MMVVGGRGFMARRELASLNAACECYFKTFFLGRDAESSKALAAPEITGFGSGVDEKVYEIGEASALYARDVEQVPSPIHFDLQRSKASLLSEGVGLVMGEMDLHLRLGGQAVSMHQVRFSLVFRRDGNHWRLCHKHLSQPSTAHGSGEGYPLREFEDQSAVLARMVAQRTEELEAAHEKLHRLATTDLLTGLHNRYYADEVLRKELARRARADSDLALILLDVDHFKPINDRWGHHAGDEVLRALAAVLRERVRETDTLGRWGGEEFILICPATNLSQATSLAEGLCQRVAAESFPVDRDVTVSLGVTAHYAGEPGRILLERADRALYQAKAAGRNRAVALMR